jgi:hypothetical protein
MSRSLFSRFGLLLLLTLLCSSLIWGGNPNPSYKVLSPISHGNLTIFPVVASATHDTSEFITLDEGIRSGEVVITEGGRTTGLIRGPSPHLPAGGPRVNTLVLVNNSKRPLILLAGEIVNGGKQDRVVAKDRVIPAESDPIDLGVFCVEPGRWTETSAQFSSMKSQMAQPSVRYKAMVKQNQQEVWDSVGVANGAIAGAVLGSSAAAPSSYAKTFGNDKVSRLVEEQAAPVEESYRSLIKQLRDQHAVGVVVAVGGCLIWADLFASTPLLEKYWPKLARSYAAEAMTTQIAAKPARVTDAQQFLDKTEGTRQLIESEAGIYRESETIAPNFKLFILSTLLPGTGFDLHVSKILDADANISEIGKFRRPMGVWSEERR